jgi:hypothetical protein
MLVDDGKIHEQGMAELRRMCRSEQSLAVLAQLACSAKRLPPTESIDLVSDLMDNRAWADDPQMPLLVWWALEYANGTDDTDTVRFPYPSAMTPKLQDFFNERTARRLVSGNIQRGLERIPTLFELVGS